MNDRLNFRAFYQGNFIYKTVTDANYYTADGKCIALANTLPNTLIWQQCTGLKDRNGKLIYEGDIVKTEWFDEMTIYQVVWDEKMACFCFDGKDIFYLFDDLPADVTEIIGNIHENPELLEQSNDD